MKERMFDTEVEGSWFSIVWNVVLFLMIMGFVLSILNSLVRARLKDKLKKNEWIKIYKQDKSIWKLILFQFEVVFILKKLRKHSIKFYSFL